MSSFLNLTVESLLNQQIELIGPEAGDLDSLWRVAGCPPEQNPRKWTIRPIPSSRSSSRYFSGLPDRPADLADERLLWTGDGEDGDPWRTGDLMTVSLIARVYAAFLDSAV